MSAGARIGEDLAVLLHRPAFFADPYGLYRHMRETAPVCWDPLEEAWVVTQYAATQQALLDARLSTQGTAVRKGRGSAEVLDDLLSRMMVFLEGAEHAAIRRPLDGHFSASSIRKLHPNLRRVAERVLDAVVDRDEFDIVAGVAKPVASAAAALMLGVEEQSWIEIARSCDAIADFNTGDPMAPSWPTTMERGVAALVACRSRVEETGLGLTRPPDDACRDLFVANVLMFLHSGVTNTVNFLGTSLFHLLSRPSAWSHVAAGDGVGGPVSIEELLRYDGPVHMALRRARTDLTIAGVSIDEGDRVILLLASANRDDSVFANPDRLVFDRRPNRHLSFGWGTHSCLGAALLRAVAGIVIGLLAERLPELELVDAEVSWQPTPMLRGPVSLMVRRRGCSSPRAQPTGMSAAMGADVAPPVVSGVSHAVLSVRDPAASSEFYGAVLGLHEVATGPGGLLLMRAPASAEHHDLGLARRPPARSDGPGTLAHLAWTVETRDDLVRVAEALSARGALIGTTDHGVSQSVYGLDPDGIVFEVMWPTDPREWASYGDVVPAEPLALPSVSEPNLPPADRRDGSP